MIEMNEKVFQQSLLGKIGVNHIQIHLQSMLKELEAENEKIKEQNPRFNIINRDFERNLGKIELLKSLLGTGTNE